MPSEWISRQVAVLARYPERRPQGLWIDSTGAFRLSALMGTWGQKQGLTREVVLAALRKHRFHDNSNILRFAMEEAPGDVTLRVHRRKDGVRESATQPGGPAPGGGSSSSCGASRPEAEAEAPTPPWTAWLLRRHVEAAQRGPPLEANKSAPRVVKPPREVAPWEAKARWQGGGGGGPLPRSSSAGAASADRAKAPEDEVERPRRPPGPNWVKYIDEGVIWWFYDGALGQWWLQDGDEEPKPWNEDD